MEIKELFYKECPTRGCRIISGFCLTTDEIKKDKKYICQNCQKESKLSKWKSSTGGEYLGGVRDKTLKEKSKKLNRCGMILPAEQKANKERKERKMKIDKWKAKWKK